MCLLSQKLVCPTKISQFDDLFNFSDDSDYLKKPAIVKKSSYTVNQDEVIKDGEERKTQ